jgi:SAM-dependent methyltransferase
VSESRRAHMTENLKQTIATHLPRSVKRAALTVGAVRLVSRATNAAARTRAAATGYGYARGWRQRSPAGDTAETRSSDESGAADRLSAFFEARDEGRGIVKWRHYFEIYDRHLARFVGGSPRLLEIGIYAGGSLDMWRDYLGPTAELYGVDIDPYCMRFEEATVFIGDQADRAFWQRFRVETPLLDIIIDDGGHTVEQQLVTLEELLPRLRPGGVYICEDIHGDENAFLAYVYGLARGLFDYDLTLDEGTPERVLSSPATLFQSAIHSVHLYPYVVVIERRDVHLDELVAAQHGTEWPTG